MPDWFFLEGLCVWSQADEKSRVEEQRKEQADAATAAVNALRESEADRFKAVEAATEAFDASVVCKHVRRNSRHATSAHDC